MQIQWLGHSCFKIQTKNNGEEIIIATDPYGTQFCSSGVPKFKADVVTISHDHDDHNNLNAIMGDPFVVRGPGEYETKGIFIYGIPAWHDEQAGQERGANIIYRINTEGINLVHLGDLGHLLSDEQIEKLGDVDILMIPVGGVFTIDAKKANEIIGEVEPRLVIPMHYKSPLFKEQVDGVEKFLKESGLPSETLDKLKINKKDLPQEETKIIIFKP
ncbi:MAG: MBL fold metallo-hydrolase [Patescibacteria group bacterium]